MPSTSGNRFKPLMRMSAFSQPLPPLQTEYSRNKKRRLFFQTDNSAKKYMLIKRTDKDNSFRTVSPFFIQKGLTIITEHIEETQRLRSGDLLVLTSNAEGVEALMKATKLADMPIRVEEHEFLNSCRGVIYSYDLMYVETDEIQKELESQNVTKVERIKRKINGELKDTPLHILTFNTTELPTDIKAGFLRLDVRMYIPSPMRCHNCQKYGHTKKKCFRTPICPKCTKAIPSGHEGIDCEPLKCANCSGEHSSYDKRCGKYIAEQEIIKIKTLDRITYIRAKEKYYRENANTTGASRRQTNQSYSDTLKTNLESNKTNPQLKGNNNNNNNQNNNNINKLKNNETNTKNNEIQENIKPTEKENKEIDETENKQEENKITTTSNTTTTTEPVKATTQQPTGASSYTPESTKNSETKVTSAETAKAVLEAARNNMRKYSFLNQNERDIVEKMQE